ncbi:hypothetical protein ABZT47_05095 [Sphaerisporangium sp. NPDC005289]|uniref:hypothetical protein n=1 Tax=Sphaerisporangium sp. NPDC005289 TaxID=3155247 RepID=UPI0033B6E7EB
MGQTGGTDTDSMWAKRFGSARRRKGRRGAAALVAGLGLLAGTAMAAPAQASATSCPRPGHGINGDGSGYMKIAANLKVSPYAACGNVRHLSRYTTVYYWCFIPNSYGNLWWWVRVAGTSTYGWMSADNLHSTLKDDNGDGKRTFSRC